jgi:hypothetical protein
MVGVYETLHVKGESPSEHAVAVPKAKIIRGDG